MPTPALRYIKPHHLQPTMSSYTILFVVALLLSGIRMAQEYERPLVFRLGWFTGLRGPGIYWIISFMERQQTIDIRTKIVNLEQ